MMEPIYIIISWYTFLISVGVFYYFGDTNLFRRQPQASVQSASVQHDDKPGTLDGLRAARAAFFAANTPASSGLLDQQSENDVAGCRDRGLGR